MYNMEADQNMQQRPLLLTVPQVAKLLGLSRAKVYSLIAQQEGPAVIRFGRSVRVSHATLKEWLEQREKEQQEQ